MALFRPGPERSNHNRTARIRTCIHIRQTCTSFVLEKTKWCVLFHCVCRCVCVCVFVGTSKRARDREKGLVQFCYDKRFYPFKKSITHYVLVSVDIGAVASNRWTLGSGKGFPSESGLGQLSRASYVAQDRFEFAQWKECGPTWSRLPLECHLSDRISGRTMERSDLHWTLITLWWFHSGRMLTPGLNRV